MWTFKTMNVFPKYNFDSFLYILIRGILAVFKF